MVRLIRPLIALLGLALLTTNAASAFTPVSAEKPASGSVAVAGTCVSDNTRLSEEAVRENPCSRYDDASDSPVAAEGAATTGARFLVNSAGDALDTEAPLYRVFGDQAQGLGQSWTTVNPGTVADYRTAAGLFPGNSGQFVIQGTLTDTSGVTFRLALPGPGGVGGGLSEVLVPNAGSQICITCVSGVNPPF